MKKLIETAKEIDRILKSGIEILPNSPIHEKLKQALNLAVVINSVCPECGSEKITIVGDKEKECDECFYSWQTDL
jgi:Zn finger protein HypA/HybF involved in hydrogenase expression